MQSATGIKLILLVVLGVLTCWTTSGLIARTKAARAKRPAQQDRNAPPVVSTVLQSVRKVEINGEAAVVQDRNPQEVLDAFRRLPANAETTLLQMDATTNGRNVVVSQSVRVLEKIPDASYIWSLRVYQLATEQPRRAATKPARKLLLERYYLNQIFHVPANVTQMTPTFREGLELEPGVYHIHVTLHRLGPTIDVRQLTEAGVREFKDGVTGFKRIVISD
jgi:hypothetical protein